MYRIIFGLCLIAGIGAQLHSALAPGALQKCVDRVSARYAAMKNRFDLQVERQFQADLARCGAPALPKSKASCVGAANYDYTRLAHALRDHKLTAAQYLLRVRDRSRKAARCMDDAVWSAAYFAGDRDGDLVPDRYDRCPNTPELAPTDVFGCPVAEPIQSVGPSREDIDRFFKLRVPLGNPKCAAATIPTVPAVVSFQSVGFPTISPPKLRSEFRKVVNQPADCPVVYQVQVEEVIHPRLDDPLTPSPRAPIRISLILKPRDALNASAAGAPTLVFESVHPRLVVLFHQGARAKIRAFNGNGIASAWSDKVKIPGR